MNKISVISNTAGIFISLLILFQNISAQPKNIFLNNISVEQGLPGENVRVILEDSKGFIWIGIDDIGLCRYDGSHFSLYNNNPNDSTSISNNFIRCIYEDLNGTLWIGTDNGLNRFDVNKKVFRTYYFTSGQGNAISSNKVSGIFEDSRGNLWVGTGKGADILDRISGKFKQVYYTDSAKKPSMLGEVFSFYEKNDILWIGSRKGLYEYSYKNETISKHELVLNSALNDKIGLRSIVEDKYNRLWLATEFGLYTYDLKKGKIGHYQFRDPDPILSCMTIDLKGRIWVGGFTSGIKVIDPDKMDYTSLVEDERNYRSIGSDYIIGLYTDRRGLVWIGTKFDGIEIYNYEIEHFNLVSEVDGLSNSYIKTVAEDAQGNIWIGTIEGGINIIDNESGKIRVLRNEENDPGSLVFDRVDYIYRDRAGTMWIGTLRGLDRFNKSSGSFTHIIPNRILSLYEDSHNIFWVSTIDGLFTLNKETGKTSQYNSDHVFFQSPSTRVNKIHEDSQGTLWFSTDQDGLYTYKISADKLTNYKYVSDDSTSLSANMVRAICEDREGNIWIGTKSNGLNKYDRKEDNFIRYTDLKGVSSISIFSIEDDENGNLWLGSSTGLIKFNPQNEAVSTYNTKHGIQGNVFELNAKFKDSENRMYFGGKNGINIFYANQIKESNEKHNLVITDVLLYNKSIAQDIFKFGEVELKHNENYLSFEFSILDFSGTEDYYYYYTLENFDDDWIYSGTKNFASYTNLPPGQYRFKITHDNPYTDPQINVLLYQVNISKPYWATIWFRLLIIVSVLSAAYLIYYVRFSALKIKQNELEELVNERTDELKRANIELKNHRNNLEQIVEERTNELRTAMNKAEESDRLKSAFLANLSHEIRTPLNAIIGFSTILTQDDFSVGEKDDIVNIINNNSNTLLSIINDIVDFSLIEAGQIVIKRQVFSIRDFLFELYQQYSEEIKKFPKFQNGNIEFSLDQSRFKTKRYLNTDPYRLRQVFNNLINNAIKFTEKGKIEIGFDIIDRKARFFVSDTGIGIDKKNVKIIFDRFWKEDLKDETHYKGTGLGLSITKNLVELMEGSIHVESEKGKGSTFYFDLPLSGQTGEISDIQNLKTHVSNPDWGGRSILIVEDIDSNFDVLKSILNKTGASILWAKDGREAVEKFTSIDNVDIVLMDIKLPVMDGKQAAKEIKKHNKNIPVIAQTAYALADEEREIREAGFDGYISKPFVSEKIIQTLSMFI